MKATIIQPIILLTISFHVIGLSLSIGGVPTAFWFSGISGSTNVDTTFGLEKKPITFKVSDPTMGITFREDGKCEVVK